jgi:tRNA (guanine10-N2)-methyltransferase
MSKLTADGRNMRGKGQKSLVSNYTQYNLNTFFLDVLTFDLTQNPIRKDVIFDAIVCDRTSRISVILTSAPYGVRAGAKRLGSKKNMSEPIIRNDGSEAHTYSSRYFSTDRCRHADFIYPTVVYELSDVLNDLMEFAVLHLRSGGRLVFWLPLIRDTNHEPRIPHHANLTLISKCEQLFNQCMAHLISVSNVVQGLGIC